MEITPENIAQIIYNRRKAMGISSEELGEKAGIADTTITRLEKGVGLPNLSTLLRICDALGLELRLEVDG